MKVKRWQTVASLSPNDCEMKGKGKYGEDEVDFRTVDKDVLDR